MLGNLSQTFKISSDRVNNAKVVFITSVDLYFRSVPVVGDNTSGFDNPGVTVSICETKINNAGMAAPQFSKILTNASRTKNASVVLAEDWNNFKFNGPVPIEPDVLYAIVVSFDGEAPFVLATSGEGVTTYQDGHLFIVSDGELKIFTDEDLVFRVKVAKFDTDYSGTEIEVLNDAFEFFHLSDINANAGTIPFLGDEIVVPFSITPEDGTLEYNSGSNRFLGTGTSFNTLLEPGNRVLIVDANTILGTNPDVLVVNNVVNSTVFFATSNPSGNAAAGRLFFAPSARVFNYSPSEKNLILWNSTASNSTFKFTDGDTLLSLESNVIFTVEDVFDYKINKITADLGLLLPPETNASIRIAFANTTYDWAETHFVKAIQNSNNIYQITNGILASRSNEVSNPDDLYDPGVTANTEYRFKSFVCRAALSTNNEFTSPYWKEDIAKLILHSAKINNTLVGETSRYGQALSKYVSEIVNLTDGLDAEDLRFFVTVTQPEGTSVQPYAKIVNAVDQIPFEDHSWTPLELKNTVLVNKITSELSHTGRAQEVIELEYGFSNRLDQHGDLLVVANGAQFFVTTENGNNVVLTNLDPADSLPTELVAGDLVGIYNPGFPGRHWITVVNSVINTTAFSTVDGAPDGTSVIGSGMFIYKVREDFKFSAFNNIFNQNVVRYFGQDTNGIFDTYKVFSIKVVMLSDEDNKTPVMADVRGVAVSS